MSKVRWVAVTATVFLYLCGIYPPLMFFYNRVAVVAGLPLFMVGLLAVSSGMLLITFLLYKYEYRQQKSERDL
ncbi:hypothetical protein [Superficieibacter sp.]|uniref:hypothetical protein n=1 Tax=Superficieibacter sp. TaxID=2303322 RepID=UPI0028B26422|nr:hypothetical protein [Superficieibacter sp.]